MQFPNPRIQNTHRPLRYNIETGEIEDSLTAYVANCVVHRDVLRMVEPFGIYGSAPDVMWSLAIRSCGFPIGFNPKARAYHLGNREDNRK
jgi:GT2 family glycosyltransferase